MLLSRDVWKLAKIRGIEETKKWQAIWSGIPQEIKDKYMVIVFFKNDSGDLIGCDIHLHRDLKNNRKYRELYVDNFFDELF